MNPESESPRAGRDGDARDGKREEDLPAPKRQQDTPAPLDPGGPPPVSPSAAHLPAPTFWPAGVAFAITLLFWGLISSWVILALGGGLLVVSLAGWITDIRHEPDSHT